MNIPEDDLSSELVVLSANHAASLIWGKTRRRMLYEFLRDGGSALDLDLELHTLRGDSVKSGPVDSFEGTSPRLFRDWIYDNPAEIIILTEHAAGKGIVFARWRTKLWLSLDPLREAPEISGIIARFNQEAEDPPYDEEDCCLYSRSLRREAKRILRQIGDAIYPAAEPLQGAIEIMLAELLAKSSDEENEAGEPAKERIPIERLINLSTLLRLRKDYLRIGMASANQPPAVIYMRVHEATSRLLEGYEDAVMGAGYVWCDFQEAVKAAALRLL